jgi:hypothetical protein
VGDALRGSGPLAFAADVRRGADPARAVDTAGGLEARSTAPCGVGILPAGDPAQRQSAARFAVNVSSRPMQDRGSPGVVNAAPARAAGASMCQSTPV